MKDKMWEEATLKQRKAIYAAYLLMPDDGIAKATFEQVNVCWAGSRLDMLRYTFCPMCYWDNHSFPTD